MHRPRVYISGPLTTGVLDPEENVQIANEWFLKMVEDGLAPLNPMLTWHVDPEAEIDHDVWMEIDLPWVQCSDAVFRIPGESTGAKKECYYANDIGIPVYGPEEYELMVADLKGRG